MNRRRLLMGIGAVILIGAVVFLYMRPEKSARVTVTPAPVATDVYANDRPLVTRLSGELAERYQTFARADAPEYFARIKPYLTPKEYVRITAENARYSGKVPFLMPVRSKVVSSDVEFEGEDKALSRVELDSTDLSDASTFKQKVEISWIRSGNVWLADLVKITETR